MSGLGRHRYSAKDVSIRLRVHWENSGLTQTEFAGNLGISQPLLNQIMSCQRAPNEAVLKLLRMEVVERYYVEIGR